MSTSTQPAPDGAMGSGVSSDETLSGHHAKDIVASSGLPDAARELILRIVKRTGLSRSEKAGVAIEMISHFGDGLDAGASIEDLLGGFGDEAMLAKLIRRSKLRCRSWLRRSVRRTRQAVLVLLVLYFGAIFYYASGSPTISVDYVAKFNESTLATPEQERAWPVYRQALLSLDRVQIKAIAERGSVFPGDPTWGDAAKLVQASQPALQQVRLAAAKPDLGYIYSTKIHEADRELFPEEYERTKDQDLSGEFDVPVVHILLPHLTELRCLRRLLAWDALLAAEQGNGDRAVEDIEAMLGLAGQMSRPDTTLIDQLVGIAIAQGAIETLGEVLRRNPAALTDAHLQRLAHRLVADDVTPVVSLEGERAFFYDVLQRVYTDNGAGDGHLLPRAQTLIRLIHTDWNAKYSGPDTGEYLLAPLLGAGTASRKEMAAKYEELYDGFVGRFAQPFWKTRLTDSPHRQWMMSTTIIEKYRYSIIAVILPAVDSCHARQQDLVGRRDGVLTALALQVYRRKHSRWPETLDQMVPGILPSVPRDRITGDPLRYRLVNGQPVVYSVGQDLDDDGGLLAAAEPVKFHKVPEGASEEMIKKVNDANKRLRNASPHEHRKRTVKSTGPTGPHTKHSHDGDWVLWDAAGWKVEDEGIPRPRSHPSR